MNKQRFRLVFSQRMGMLVPVAEDRAAQGKASGDAGATGGTSPPGPSPMRLRKLALALLAAGSLGVLLAASPRSAHAAPSGASVVSGTASITQSGNATTIANSPNAIINWASFSAAQQEVIRFVQQSASSAVLNRVTGADPSVILGQLLSNGRVFLINPNGVAFGAGSRVETAGLVASSLGMKDADFIAGRYRFDKDAGATGAGGAGGGAVTSSGLITVSAGGPRTASICMAIPTDPSCSTPGSIGNQTRRWPARSGSMRLRSTPVGGKPLSRQITCRSSEMA